MRHPTSLIGVAFLLFVVAVQSGYAATSPILELERRGLSTSLIVLIHAYTQDAASLDHVRKAVRAIDEFRDADLLVPELPFGMFSMASSTDVVAKLLHLIDATWEQRAATGKPYARIVLVGHSIGGLFARKVYAAACGENADTPFEPDLRTRLAAVGAPPLDKVRPWAPAVDRIVLMAGMNRGWSISHHMSLGRAAAITLGVAAGRMLSPLYGRPPLILTMRRGAPFITQLRLQWLSMREHVNHNRDKAVGGALTVQLLGSIDDLVSPDDNLDLVSGGDFRYLDVPYSGHANVIQMDDTPAGIERQVVFRKAMTLTDFDSDAVPPVDKRASTENRKVMDVVFVIHGIRDEGYWTHKIARRIISKGRKRGQVIASETSSYGYFPMLSFLRPGARQEKVEWLMDQYTQAKAEYPEAQFSYVGHSNGTYLLAKALRDYPAVRFKHVVFAGSVVERDYQWPDYMPDRVQAVVNFVATADWVVAFFPNALQMLGVQDLGSAGHDGFAVAGRNPAIIEPKEYVIGGHGAALKEAMWDSIADFVVTGEFHPPPAATLAGKRAWWVVYPGKVAPLIWIVIAFTLWKILRWILRLRLRESLKTIAVIAYVGIVLLVLTEL